MSVFATTYFAFVAVCCVRSLLRHDEDGWRRVWAIGVLTFIVYLFSGASGAIGGALILVQFGCYAYAAAWWWDDRHDDRPGGPCPPPPHPQIEASRKIAKAWHRKERDQ